MARTILFVLGMVGITIMICVGLTLAVSGVYTTKWLLFGIGTSLVLGGVKLIRLLSTSE